MPLTFLIDENLRGALPAAIQQHNMLGADLIDAITVGDRPDLPLGSLDEDILVWAERAGRILVTRDMSTMISRYIDHLRAGHHCPGVLIVRPGFSLPDIVEALAIAAHAGSTADFLDQVDFIPQ